MSPSLMTGTGTSESDEAFVVVSRQVSATYMPKQVFLPMPCHLRALASELTVAFTDELAGGAVLNNTQEPASFKRLNGRVNDLLKAYSLAGAGDWRSYASWNEHNYLRHLLWATEEFEVMLLCWRAGQTSRVHTHANSHCWFAVLEGEMRETQYPPIAAVGEAATEPSAVPTRIAAAGDLTPTLVTDKTVGDVAYINDNIAIHSVGCCRRDPRPQPADGTAGAADDGQGALACTLHVYCPPIRRAKALEGGKLTECTPGFFSRHCILAA